MSKELRARQKGTKFLINRVKYASYAIEQLCREDRSTKHDSASRLDQSIVFKITLVQKCLQFADPIRIEQLFQPKNSIKAKSSIK